MKFSENTEQVIKLILLLEIKGVKFLGMETTGGVSKTSKIQCVFPCNSSDGFLVVEFNTVAIF